MTSALLLRDLVRCSRPTSVLDIGANPIDGDAPYKQMLDDGLCTVTGFEPQQRALAELNQRKGRWSDTCRMSWATATRTG